MRLTVGSVLYVAALVMTAIVVAAKYFGLSFPPVTAMAMKDPAQTLLLALLLSFVARFI